MSEWIRVNRTHPCPACGKDSWCTYNGEVVICMRQSGGKEKTFRDGSVGWVHRMVGEQSAVLQPAHRIKEPEVTINAKKIMEEFAKNRRNGELHWLAKNLGVTVESLMQIGCVGRTSPCLRVSHVRRLWQHGWNSTALQGRKEVGSARKSSRTFHVGISVEEPRHEEFVR